MPAEDLYLVEAPGLEREHGQHRHADNYPDIAPFEAVDRHHISGINAAADQRDQRKLDKPDQPGEHDLRIGWRDVFGGRGERGGGELALFGLGAGGALGRRDGCGLDHPAGVELGHGTQQHLTPQ
jgi:hypothetical protein